MSRGSRSRWLALALLSTSSVAVAQEPSPTGPAATPAPPAATPAVPPEVKLELVIGEVKTLALDDTKGWSVFPEGGIVARPVDDGRTLRLVAQKDGTYTIRIERNDGTILSYAVRVGKEPAPTPVPAASNTPTISGQSADEKYTRNTIDLNLEGGGGRHFGDPFTTLGFGRARVGVMFARWPVFTMIGATYEFNNLSPATFGLQGELLQLSGGVWGQLGGSVDVHGKAGVMESLGFSVVGVEAQYRGYEDSGYGLTLLGKVRIPIGVILYAFDLNKKK
jgi:hypothetical protein